jgi:hypothetical protein
MILILIKSMVGLSSLVTYVCFNNLYPPTQHTPPLINQSPIPRQVVG